MNAYPNRIRSASGNPDSDYWQSTCDTCPWGSLAMHPNRTIEGKRLAQRDSDDHNSVYHPDQVAVVRL